MHEFGSGPSRSRRLSAFVSVVRGIAAARARLSARQFMTHERTNARRIPHVIRLQRSPYGDRLPGAMPSTRSKAESAAKKSWIGVKT